jgi:co-chaperonin GroES (HSP10)
MIRPIKNQILIRPILEDKFSSGSALVIPDSAKKSTVQGSDGSMVNFVKAEVIAVGPGRRRVDSDLLPEVVATLERVLSNNGPLTNARIRELLKRIADPVELIPLDVKPGDTILYHPSVRNFDRSVDVDGVEHFLIGEHSLLAIVNLDEAKS